MRLKIVRSKKGAFEMDMLAWWIWGVVGLILVLGVIFILKDKGVGAMSYIRNLFGIGR
jgi:hypothetical protein